MSHCLPVKLDCKLLAYDHSNYFAFRHRCLERTGEFSKNYRKSAFNFQARLKVPLGMKTSGNGGLRTENFPYVLSLGGYFASLSPYY